MRDIHILFPVLNEEKRLVHGVEESVKYMDEHFSGRYHISIIDNGSTDRTEELGMSLKKRYLTVDYVKLNERGVGIALREGVRQNDSDIVGYMDIDLSTKIQHLLDMDKAFSDESVQIVNGSRLSKGSKVIGRKFFRECTSRGLKYILKLLLGMKIDDVLCGFKFFRKEVIEQLIVASSDTNGWFFCAELLLRAEKRKIKIEEIPVVWEDDYNTTVNVPKLVKEYLKQIFRLFVELRIKRNI